jgi:hypothetical protein
MYFNLHRPARRNRLIPTGSLLQSHSKLDHEMIAGPILNGEQFVAHKEPEGGCLIESLQSALQRYPLKAVIPPVSNQHGVVAWNRMAAQVGEPWSVLDNCQHAARRAYAGQADSPTLNAALAISVFLWMLSQHKSSR